MTADRTPTEDHDRLADALRREAQTTRPAFSESVHARIHQAVNAERTIVAPHRTAMPWRRHWTSLVVAAAALLLAVSLTAWWLSRPSQFEPELTRTTTSEPDLTEFASITGLAAEQLGQLVDSTLMQQQWGYLDHDVQLAAQLFMGLLPVGPATSETPTSDAVTPPPPETSG